MRFRVNVRIAIDTCATQEENYRVYQVERLPEDEKTSCNMRRKDRIDRGLFSSSRFLARARLCHRNKRARNVIRSYQKGLELFGELPMKNVHPEKILIYRRRKVFPRDGELLG